MHILLSYQDASMKRSNRLKYPGNQRLNVERKGRTTFSTNHIETRSRSRSKSQNRKQHFQTNQQHHEHKSYASVVQGTNNNQGTNFSTIDRSVERDSQIEKLQQQINFLRDERKGHRAEQSRNEAAAPKFGAFHQSQAGTKQNQEMTTKDVIDLINSTMINLNRLRFAVGTTERKLAANPREM